MAKTAVYFLLIMATLEAAVRLNERRLTPYLFAAPSDAATDYARLPRPPDLCFLGSSLAMTGFSDETFRGQTVLGERISSTLNLGVPGGGIGTWAQIRRVVLPRPPKVVVYGVAPFEFNARLRFSLTDLPARDFLAYNRLNFSPENLWPWLVGGAVDAALRRWALYRDRQAIVKLAYDLLQRHLGSKWRANALVVLRHQIKSSDEALADRLKNAGFVDHGLLADFRFGNAFLFEDDLDQLLSRGVKVVLVDIPVSGAERSQEYTPAIMSQYLDYVSRQARARGLTFLTPSAAECGLEDADYWDLAHLLDSGRDKFSRCVLTQLRRAGAATAARAKG